MQIPDGRYWNTSTWCWEWYQDGRLVSWVTQEVIESSPFNGDVDRFVEYVGALSYVGRRP